jgi:hypothetical protein
MLSPTGWEFQAPIASQGIPSTIHVPSPIVGISTAFESV